MDQVSTVDDSYDLDGKVDWMLQFGDELEVLFFMKLLLSG